METKRPVGRPESEFPKRHVTFNCKEEIIMKAKIYAVTHKTSVSDLIEMALVEYMRNHE